MIPRLRVLPALLCLLAPLSVVQAQDRGGGGLGVEITAVAAGFGAADLDGGGEVEVDRYLASAAVVRPVSRRARVGVEFSYQYSDYRFSGASNFGGGLWGDLRRAAVAVPVFYSFSRRLGLFASATASSTVEAGASLGDGIAWGGLAVFNYSVSPELTVGLGAAAFRNIESTDAFPVITVEWQPTPDWWLGNPLPIGPVTPAGLELRWTGGDTWTLAGGAAWRSDRFRLDGDGPVPDGVGEISELPVFVRASRQLGGEFRAHVVAGVSVSGELTVEDEDGRRLVSVDRGSAPFLALGLQGRF
jgi:hypothetical protein